MFCLMKGKNAVSVVHLLGAGIIDIAYFTVLLLVSRPAEALIDFRLFAVASFCLLVAIDSLILRLFPDKASSNQDPETPSSSFAAALVISLAGNLLSIGFFILLVWAVFT
ncbi:MAG: hypothetical protein ACD_39C01464G0001 [uncultured bacterium]|nr:MAG: hypothetical protein ACD_39C01464G0001 [uncultured bacterium]